MESNMQFDVETEPGAQWSVGDEQEKYTLILGQAIESYVEELRAIERRIASGPLDDDAIQSAIVTLTDNILKLCAQFEQKVKDKEAIKATRSYFHRTDQHHSCQELCYQSDPDLAAGLAG